MALDLRFRRAPAYRAPDFPANPRPRIRPIPRSRLLPWLPVFLLLTFGPRAEGQSLTSGVLTGVVVDTAGRAVGGAIVTVTEPSTGVDRAVTTGRDGTFRFGALATGTYEVFAEDFGFRPTRIVGVVLGPVGTVRMTIPLRPEAPPVTTVDTIAFAGARATLGRGASARVLGDLELARTPDAGRDLLQLGRYLSDATPALEVDGLQERHSARLMDGILFDGLRHPALLSDPTAGTAYPLLAVRRAELLTNDGDVERSEYAAGQLAGYSQGGSRSFRVRLFGDWSGEALRSSDHFAAGIPGQSDLRGGVAIGGPVIPDTAHFLIGVEGQRTERALPRTWLVTDGDSALAALADSFGVDLAPELAPRGTATERISAFGRFDWRVAERSRVSARLSGGTFRTEAADFDRERWTNLGQVVEGTEVTAGVTLSSEIGEVALNELRVGVEVGSRDFLGGGLPGTTVLEDDIRFGTSPVAPGRFERTAVRLSEVLHIAGGNHQVKVGVMGVLSSVEQAFTYDNTGSFVFADLARFAAGEGVYTQVGGPPPVASFGNNQLAAFLQDTWSVTPQFDLLAGLRYELEFLPAGDVPPNPDWVDRSGLFTDSIGGRKGKFSPRLGFTWRLGGDRWVVRAQGGIFYDRVDPGLLAELISHARGLDVRRGVGVLGTWPEAPSGAVAPVRGARLTLLGPDFEPPRSSRGSFGISRYLGRGGAIHVSTSYRHTDFLPRRTDLNRLPAPAGEDQHGRPLWGDLVQQGALIVRDPGTNRRFGQFDLVSAVNVDGFSDYWDVSAALEQRVGRFLELVARYTYSQTTDNWLAAGAGGAAAQLNPFPEGLDGTDWTDGRSDFDIPHRFVLAAELRPLGRPGFSVSGFYRYQSGFPFTPGFPAGVDVNGDGTAGNDPAFVDPDIAGIDDLVAAWECLALHAGGFVERNACRADGESTLDLRAVIGPVRIGTYPVELYVDALNVLDAERPILDEALYAIDPAGAVTTDPATGALVLPLMANPAFGTPLAFRGTGRALRIGMRVNY